MPRPFTRGGGVLERLYVVLPGAATLTATESRRRLRAKEGSERERAGNMPLSKSNLLRSPCSRKLCRNLFGPVDHDQLQKDFQSLMKAQLEEAQQKWNFDFESETPLEGNYKWEKVSHLNRMPSQDLLSPTKEDSCAGEKSLSSPVLLKMHTKTDRPTQVARKSGSPRSSKRKQTTIKDFYSSKRRTVPCKSDP
ncbi:cyclin-dependent kinase inhibitor 1 [Lacerta agilis]|uniref:cyclin-dependent kinase inhibitor 1 n=1 Tax=Lacerta agilis TaxID=80427 RepID=UPI001419FF19|nr:cyclin-dependent kinase inhibitor 1 [Lacerta agilis]